MARAVECIFEGKTITIEKALLMGSNSDYQCAECGMPVRPHKPSQYGEAHFEHQRRTPQCTRSDPER